jgi:LL-diaminopimelate aminotransferase
MKYQSNRLSRLQENYFDAINSRIAELDKEGCDVIRLDIGSPDLPPPNSVIKALCSYASKSNYHGYGSHRGTSDLRNAWASLYKRSYKVNLNSEDEVLPLLGSKEGIAHISLAILNPGDIALVPDPGYMTYTSSALLAGGIVHKIPLLPENDYQPNFSIIPPEVAENAKLLWLNYPNNPTTAVATIEFFKQAIEFASKNDIIICHDAAYSRVTYSVDIAPSILQIKGARKVAVEFNSLSKAYNMAGWRVGAVLGNKEIISALLKLKTHVDSGHYKPILDAAVVALNSDYQWIKKRNNTYQKRRDVVVQALRKIGLDASNPQATLYIWSPIPDRIRSYDFVLSALENAHVSMTPGTIFGELGEGFVRIALTKPISRLYEAMQRLEIWMKKEFG